MSGGSVRLVTPDGYCIDRRSLEDQFALIGRCDTLGVVGAFAANELAIITVSTLPLGETALATVTLASAQVGGEVMETVAANGASITRMSGASDEVDGVSDEYWRSAFVLKNQLVSLALYAPPESQATGRDGVRLLEALTSRTRAASAARPEEE